MFRKKSSRAAAHAANAPPASSAASTAAVQAFLASRASNTNLSSAAAAAALRSHTASPTNPASIQTKRMQRRLSNSSNGSAAGRPTLHRSGSNGSMTERTFRDQSPSQTGSRSNSPYVDHPPIPPIPKSLAKRTKERILRPASAEPPPRVMSPVQKPGGRGVSLDRGNVKPKNEIIPPLPKQKLTKINTVAAAEQLPKRTSVNFSRPMSPALSPPSSPMPANGKVGKSDPKIITADDVDAIDYTLKNEATGSVKKKPNRSAKGIVEGSHLAKGHSSAKPTGTAVEALEAANNKEASPQRLTSSTSRAEQPAEETKTVRAPGKLNKQPSLVREDAEGEQLAEKDIESPAPKSNGSAFQPKATPNGKALKSSIVTPTSSNQILTPTSGGSTQRRSSLSPARTARFSAQPAHDLAGGIRHEPPPRAVSPAKSALKQSPSPRGPSPAFLNDVSDTISVGSEEGRRKKKTVRVSFEESPVIVGRAAEVDPSRSPFVLSPQNQDASSRLHFNFKNANDDMDQDETISPMPTLPSFGSIRGRKDRHSEDDHKALYGNEQARKNLVGMTSSSDHAIGAIVSGDAASKRDPKQPVPPEVTSVEGSGENSDHDSSDEEVSRPVKTTEFPDIVANPVEEQLRSPISQGAQPHDSSTVPVIAVLPATPGQDTEKVNRDSWLSGMPGSFNPRDSTTNTETDGSADTISAQEDMSLPKRESIVEPEPESAQREHSPDSPTVGSIAESLRRQEDDENGSNSGDSVYSDAAEDPVDPEGDGFGSINAIVDSPVASPVVSPIPKSSKGKERATEGSPSPSGRVKAATDWEVTKNYWSGINEGTKSQQVEPQPVGIAISSPQPKAAKSKSESKSSEPTIPPKSTARLSQKPKAPADTSKAVPKAAPKAATKNTSKSAPVATAQQPAPKKSALKQTVRPTSEQPSAPIRQEIPAMRKTMRGPQPPVSNVAPASRNSVAGRDLQSESPASMAKPKQPLGKTSLSSNVNGSANRLSTISTKSAPAGQTIRSPPKVSRTMSNGSDSSSSFKKERRSRPRQTGAYTMKRSMRDSKPQPQLAEPPARDINATLRNRPMSVTGVTLRTSMRDRPNIPQRPSSVRASSPTGSFFSRKKKAPEKPLFSRKFSDSSADDMPTTYRSRFADSSDEEEVLTPVRGIPKRTVEEDSTDLDDSDVETKPRPATVTPKPTASTTSALASKSMRSPVVPSTPVVTNLTIPSPSEKKKRSFFGVLGRKKDKSKIGKSELDSPARRDTPLERTKLERTGIENRVATPEPPTPLETPAETPLASPLGSPSPGARPGKLQRRVTPQRTASGSWPLPPSPPPDEPVEVRPTTSDGTVSRPPMGNRQISNVTNIADGVAVGRSGKKKRFTKLRKAFGLHD